MTGDLQGARPEPGIVDRLARRLVIRHLPTLRREKPILAEGNDVLAFGETDGLHANMRVHHPRFFRETALGGTMAVAESYLRGD